MRKFLSVALGAAALLGAAPAFAQQDQFGKQMDIVFSADRLFGIALTHQVDEDRCGGGPNRRDCEYDSTSFGLGWRGRGQHTPFEVPRFAFDIFVIDSLSIGGSIAFASYDNEDDPGDNDYDFSEFLISPRIGYAIMFSDVFGFWPRGGFTYHSTSVDDNGPGPDTDENGFALTLEAAFVVTPVEHFGFWFGPTLDLDITGEVEDEDGDDWDRRYRSIGILNVGLFGWI